MLIELIHIYLHDEGKCIFSSDADVLISGKRLYMELKQVFFAAAA
jgi:hypothetical protein